MSKLTVYMLCEECNAEFKLHSTPAPWEGKLHMEGKERTFAFSVMENCPDCNHTNHVWMRFVMEGNT